MMYFGQLSTHILSLFLYFLTMKSSCLMHYRSGNYLSFSQIKMNLKLNIFAKSRVRKKDWIPINKKKRNNCPGGLNNFRIIVLGDNKSKSVACQNKPKATKSVFHRSYLDNYHYLSHFSRAS